MAERIAFTSLLPFFVYSFKNIAVNTPTGIAIIRLIAIVISVATIDGKMLIVLSVSNFPNSSFALRFGIPLTQTNPIMEISPAAATPAAIYEKILPIF